MTYTELQPKLQELFNSLSDTSVKLAAAQNKLKEMEVEIIKIKHSAAENGTSYLDIKHLDVVDIRAFAAARDVKESTNDLVTKAKGIIDNTKKEVELLISQRDVLRGQYEATEKLTKASLNNVEEYHGRKGS